MKPLNQLGIHPKSVLDIGANVGGFTREAMSTWPDASIVMIEANDACSGQLSAIPFPHHIAVLGDCNRLVTFYRRKGGGTDTGDSYKRELTQFFDDESIEPSTVMLSTLPEVVGKDAAFDLIKLDVQGAELDVIRGGEEIVRRAKWVLMEVSIEAYNEGAPLWDEVIGHMQSIGFGKFEKIGDICHPINRNTIQHDVLFTNQRHG